MDSLRRQTIRIDQIKPYYRIITWLAIFSNVPFKSLNDENHWLLYIYYFLSFNALSVSNVDCLSLAASDRRFANNQLLL